MVTTSIRVAPGWFRTRLATAKPRWSQGDFNGDGKVDIYFLESD